MNESFAKNFQTNLIVNYDEAKLKLTKQFLLEYLALDDFENLTFLDAGCGSGVFTLAALDLGAKVFSFDIDPVAIENTTFLINKFKPKNRQYELQVGNILNKDFINNIGLFDLVLCWGVVHHCGEMWRGIDLISKTVKKGGLIHLGIYNHADGWGFYPDGRFGPSSFWLKIKRFYVKLPSFFQRIIDVFATFSIVLVYLLSFKNPIKKLKSNERRGMSWQSDLKDWLIGYPYEYARPEEVFDFMKERGFTLQKMKTNNGLLTNNYVFKKN